MCTWIFFPQNNNILHYPTRRPHTDPDLAHRGRNECRERGRSFWETGSSFLFLLNFPYICNNFVVQFNGP